MANPDENNILIKNIVLVESKFHRTNLQLAIEQNDEVNLNIKIENEDEKEFYVYVLLEYKLKNKSNEEIANSNIIMKGIFELTNQKPGYFNEFICINAPAIIYPYLREHLSSLTNKAGLPTVNLPPFNFVKFGNDYLKNNYSELKDK